MSGHFQRKVMKTPSITLKCVLFMLIAGCAWLAISAVLLAATGNYLPLFFALVLWAPLGWGLWQMHPVARRVAVTLLWLIVVVLPIGVINPFAAMDGVVATDKPLWQVALPVFGVVAMAVFTLHILGKHKAEFGHDVER